MFVFGFAYAGCLLHGLLLWNRGVITLGEVIAFVGLFNALRYPTFMSILDANLVRWAWQVQSGCSR